MSRASAEGEFRAACEAYARTRASGRERAGGARGGREGTRIGEETTGGRERSRGEDGDVDAYVAACAARRTLVRACDGIAHAQRAADAVACVEAVEIEMAWRREAAFAALRTSARTLEDALVDGKLVPDALVGMTRRCGVERARGALARWNERIEEARADENSVERADVDADALAPATAEAEARIEEDRVDKYTSSRLSSTLTSEDAVRRIQAAFRGYASRLKTTAEARDELVHLGMASRARGALKRLDDESERMRRERARSRSEKELVALEERIRRETLIERSQSIREEIKAALEERTNAGDGADATDERTGALRYKNPVDSVQDELGDSVSSEEDRFRTALDKYKQRWPNGDGFDLNAFDVDYVRASILLEVTNKVKEEMEEEMRALEMENKKKLKSTKKASRAEGASTKKKSEGKAPSKKPKISKLATTSQSKEIDHELVNMLARMRILEPTSLNQRLSDYVGSGGERREDRDDGSSMLSIFTLKHILEVSVIAPLASQQVHELTPHVKCVLLEGPRANGKSYLARLCAAEAGASLYNLSPDRLAHAEACGAEAKSLIKSVFQAAKTSTPSVIFIRDIDGYFPDKGKKSKSVVEGTESARKVRKDVAKEIKALKPGSQVVVICTRSVPFGASASDPKGFGAFFNLRLEVPPPDYGGRRRILSKAFEASARCEDDRPRRRTGEDANATLACHAASGMTTGELFALVRGVASAENPWRELARAVSNIS